MIKEALAKLTCNEDLSFDEAKSSFEEIFQQKVTPAQLAAFLIALKMKGEVKDEIWAAATVVREKATKVNVRQGLLGIEDEAEPVLDTCGTGGSGINKFNVSTAVSFVVAACGIKVAKHGNRAMSSNCGSADAFDALGIKIDVEPRLMEEAIKKLGIGFLYAPLYHPALKEVAGVRKEMGVRTIFNILGPLCSPAFASHQLMGVYRRDLVPLIAQVMKNLGVKSAFVVYGHDTKDEVSLSGKTDVAYLHNKKVKRLSLVPSDFGLKRVSLKDLEVKDAAMSAQFIKDIMDGKKGAPRDMVLASSACCFFILGKAQTLKAGVKLSAELIDSGKVKQKYLNFKQFIHDAQHS